MRQGFVTATMVPDCNADKAKLADSNLNQLDPETGLKVPKIFEYAVPKAYQFRKEAELELGQKDFSLRNKVPEMDNPHGLSVFAAKPKFITDKEKERAEKTEAHEKFMKAGKPHDWLKYHKLP